MKEKIIQMDNERSYYILEEITYNSRRYVLAFECDPENDIVNKEELFVMEVVVENDDLVIMFVKETEEIKQVTKLLFEKIEKETTNN